MKIWGSFIGLVVFLSISGGLNSRGLGADATASWTPGSGVNPRATSTFRWKDIATNTYAQAYQDSYDYDQAFIEFSYDQTGDATLRGHISASNLKPNFAYQMKLAGKPSAIWGSAGDDVTNERIGYLGRWWRHQPNPGNSTDADYEANHDQTGYIYEGYLVFSFLVTDSTGSVDSDFSVDSSFHVLWWETQRSPGGCDSPIQWSMVVGHADHPAYQDETGPVSIGVYAEIERECTGGTTMPIGLYDCCFLLTEESFHQSGEDEGNWMSVLIDDSVQFEIVDVSAVDVEGFRAVLSANELQPNPFLDRTMLKFTLSQSHQVGFSVFDLQGRRVRHYPPHIRGPGEHRMGWDGRDDAGRGLASGVYFFRLEAGSHFETRRTVLIK